MLQRLIFLAIGVVALLGLVWRGAAGSRVAAGARPAARRSPASRRRSGSTSSPRSSASCNLTLADQIVNATELDRLLPDVFEARASCADAAVSLLGVPYAFWAALAFVVCAIALVRVLRARV